MIQITCNTVLLLGGNGIIASDIAYSTDYSGDNTDYPANPNRGKEDLELR